MSTLAEVKRNIVAGATIHIENYYYPAVSGDREVLKATTSHLTMTWSDPDQPTTQLAWPKAVDAKVDEDGRGFVMHWPALTASGRRPHPRAGEVQLHLRIVETAS